MSDALLATISSLASIMAEETSLLADGRLPAEIAPLAAAKLRLIGALEAASAEQVRARPDWLEDLSGAERKALLDAVSTLREAAAANAMVLRRQIDLSQDLMGEIASEARRLGGTRQQTYRRSGQLQKRDDPAPVAVNTRL